MDEELRIYLGDMKWDLEAKIEGSESRIVSLTASEIGSLHAEIGEVRSDIGRINERLDRQGFMLSGGTKALGGLLEHVVNVEGNYTRVLTEMRELRARVDKLEKRAS
jgi:hypothetical protein